MSIAKLGRLPRQPLLWLIRLYQRTVSLALPPNTCRFYPSCSHYGYEAIEKYGIIKGGAMATWRIMRCNPWNDGGFDPVK
ncbi:MAG TPA: membrane protein insertion efficiency factor YidD [Chloroflexia bacterium]|jgi:putative membrane protein insertion efficiency factor|nr:membrane protein insertion efficiency factor YidD [Chloroflexia bacterium]